MARINFVDLVVSAGLGVVDEVAEVEFGVGLGGLELDAALLVGVVEE